jgi:stress response protein SCP2
MANILNKNEQLIIGINWGGAKTKGWFGSIEYMMADLDLNILIVDKVTMNIKEVVNNKNTSKGVFDKGIIIEKDDNYGDLSGNDGKDNEWGIINLEHLSLNHFLIPIIYNYSKVNWKELSHLEFRIYNGEPNGESRIVYFQNLKDLEFESKDILIPGRIYQNSNEWCFETYDIKEKANLLNTMGILNQLRIPF